MSCKQLPLLELMALRNMTYDCKKYILCILQKLLWNLLNFKIVCQSTNQLTDLWNTCGTCKSMRYIDINNTKKWPWILWRKWMKIVLHKGIVRILLLICISSCSLADFSPSNVSSKAKLMPKMTHSNEKSITDQRWSNSDLWEMRKVPERKVTLSCLWLFAC